MSINEHAFQWPAPANLAAASEFIARFRADEAVRGAPQPIPEAMLAALGGNSPYLSELALKEPETIASLAQGGPGAAVGQALRALAEISPRSPRGTVAAAMRRAKRRVALAVALADIGGVWHLDHVTGALSRLAEETLELGLRHLLLIEHGAGRITLPEPDQNPAQGSGFFILALGKLGGRELNYSSDIDLIVLYDPSAMASAPDTIGAIYTRLARDLVKLMEARESDGYVFRVDLRLRPDPSAMPLAISVPSAMAYYETMGRNWERTAFIKARPVAGDTALGQAFVDSLRPFVWRRHLDFAAIADIHAMKRLMDAHRGGPIPDGTDPVTRLLGHDLKVGRGGIREIEFLAQSQQLVWGGREPVLRVGATVQALRLLTRLGHMDRATVDQLTQAYRFLRQVEHRLQMIADRQTHALPARAEDFAHLAIFMGFATARGFAEALLHHHLTVQSFYDSFFEMEEMGEAITVGPSGSPPPEATLARLRRFGYGDPPHVVEIIRHWLSGRPRALRSERARALLDHILPHILRAIGAQPQPDQALAHFDDFISRLPAGVQLFSLFSRNPALIDRIAMLLGAAPGLAHHLANHPGSLEGLLGSEDARAEPMVALQTQLIDAKSLEDVVSATSRLVNEERFRINVASLEGRMDVDDAGLARTAIADAAIMAILDAVLSQHRARYGWLHGSAFAVLLLGKGGSREMMPGSDLDLMFIYDQTAEAEASDGPKPLAASQWFARLVTAFTNALTARGAEGALYTVDMRLRPSGNKGPVAVNLSAFRKYHAEQAWTWEQMALTRARIVTTSEGFRPFVQEALDTALIPRLPPDRLRADALDMRRRVLKEMPPQGPWDVKLLPGGTMDVEFLAQILQLIHGAADPNQRDTATATALARLGTAGCLPEPEASALIEADRFWRTIQSALRLTVGHAHGSELPEASGRILCSLTGDADMPALKARMARTADLVRASFIRHIGDPALPRA